MSEFIDGVEFFDLPRLTVMRCPDGITRRIQRASYGPRPFRWTDGFALRMFGRLVLICRRPAFPLTTEETL